MSPDLSGILKNMNHIMIEKVKKNREWNKINQEPLVSSATKYTVS
jgi:hypothetical protein